MKKRILAIALTIVLIFTIAPTVVFAEKDPTEVAALAELQTALIEAAPGDTILATDDITITNGETVTVPNDVRVMLHSDQDGGKMLTVASGGTLNNNGRIDSTWEGINHGPGRRDCVIVQAGGNYSDPAISIGTSGNLNLTAGSVRVTQVEENGYNLYIDAGAAATVPSGKTLTAGDGLLNIKVSGNLNVAGTIRLIHNGGATGNANAEAGGVINVAGNFTSEIGPHYQRDTAYIWEGHLTAEAGGTLVISGKTIAGTSGNGDAVLQLTDGAVVYGKMPFGYESGDFNTMPVKTALFGTATANKDISAANGIGFFVVAAEQEERYEEDWDFDEAVERSELDPMKDEFWDWVWEEYGGYHEIVNSFLIVNKEIAVSCMTELAGVIEVGSGGVLRAGETITYIDPNTEDPKGGGRVAISTGGRFYNGSALLFGRPEDSGAVFQMSSGEIDYGVSPFDGEVNWVYLKGHARANKDITENNGVDYLVIDRADDSSDEIISWASLDVDTSIEIDVPTEIRGSIGVEESGSINFTKLEYRKLLADITTPGHAASIHIDAGGIYKIKGIPLVGNTSDAMIQLMDGIAVHRGEYAIWREDGSSITILMLSGNAEIPAGKSLLDEEFGIDNFTVLEDKTLTLKGAYTSTMRDHGTLEVRGTMNVTGTITFRGQTDVSGKLNITGNGKHTAASGATILYHKDAEITGIPQINDIGKYTYINDTVGWKFKGFDGYLRGIEVKRPNKLDYIKGEELDLTGMIVTADYWGDTQKTVLGYTVTPAGGTILTAAGYQDVLVTYSEGGITHKQSFTVTVNPLLPTDVTLSPASKTLDIDQTVQLSAAVKPDNATDKSVTWSSSKTSVAVVSNTGKVTAKAAGTAVITAKTNSGGKTATCKITVNPIKVTKISLSNTVSTMITGKTHTLKATVTPTNATNKAVTWSSSDAKVAKVDQNGKVTAVGAGKVTIKATAKDGSGKSAGVTITVHQYVTMKVGKTTAIQNGVKTSIDNAGSKPIKISGKTMVPLRFVGEKMGGKVGYVNDSKPITMSYGNTTVEFRLGDKRMKVTTGSSSKTITLEVAAQKVGGKTYIPLRAIGQALGFDVYYEAGTEYIVVNNPKMTAAIKNERLAEAKKVIQ